MKLNKSWLHSNNHNRKKLKYNYVPELMRGCIAKRKVPTLILVHRHPLLEQWKEQLSRFLGIPIKQIGVFTGAKKKPTGKIDIATILSLKGIDDLEEFFSSYGQIIIDECHHIPAVTFESILKRSSARFVLGLTATPYRKDGHQKILFMQCGPVRHEIKIVSDHLMSKRVIIKETRLKLSEDLGDRPPIHLVWDELTADSGRLDLIAGDVIAALGELRFPLLISDRKEHLVALESRIKALSNLAVRTFRLEGSMYRKRVQAYKGMGYQIHAPAHSTIANRGIQASLFD